MRVEKSGFTLIELLIVVALLGILVVIAIPKFSGARERAYRTQMVTDLRTLTVAQESYFSEAFTYADDVDELNFNQTPTVNIDVLEASAAGWSAQVTHDNTDTICGFFTGPVTIPPDVSVTEGVIGCTD